MANTRTSFMAWREHRLTHHDRLSGYGIVRDENYPTMWRVRSPDGSLSDMVNRTRAKDAALGMLDRDLRCAESLSG
jgi:hypothetical protein